MKQYIVGLVVFLLCVSGLYAQREKSSIDWVEKIKDFKIKPVLALQLWTTYTTDAAVYDANTQSYERIDNRLNTQMRRSRVGVKGNPYPNLSFNITAAFDLVGRDVLSGTEGGFNNGGSPKLRLWNGYVRWKMAASSNSPYLTAGYMLPVIGRASITSALRVSSMEKSWAQNYLRRQLVGTGPGRAMGINVGALYYQKDRKSGWGYDIGVFNPAFTELNGNSVGKRFAPLFAGRLAAYIGDSEGDSYTSGKKINYFGMRKGLTVAVAAAYQGASDLFDTNTAVGMDWLFNWAQLHFSGEWTFLERKTSTANNGRNVQVASNTGFVCLGYNIVLSNGKVIEPVLMLTQFNGALDSETQSYADQVGAFAGTDHAYEISINYYFHPDLKLTFGYTLRNGDIGNSGAGATFNNYFYQGGAGAIRRGNWFGIGLVSIF